MRSLKINCGRTTEISAILTLVWGLIATSSAAAQALVADLPSGQMVGTTILWSVSPAPAGSDFRFSASKFGSPPKVISDFSDQSAWQWPPLEDGLYRVEASVREINTGIVTPLVQLFYVSSRVTTSPIVRPTDHPLVALYSAPPCLQGLKMRVNFFSFNPRRTYSTDFRPCDSRHSMNFYLGGLMAEKGYVLAHEVQDAQGGVVARGPARLHFTGSIPVEIPTVVVSTPPGLDSSLLESLVLVSPLNFIDDTVPQIPFAADLSGRVVWYYDRTFENRPQLYRPNSGGTFLLVEDVNGVEGQTLREIDIAGHVVRETTAQRISEQVAAFFLDPVTSIHHEALRLPDGRTAVLASVERIMNGVQGAEGPVDILGDYVLVLDENFQVVWVWDAFMHLDVERAAILGEICGNVPPVDAGCPPIVLVDGVTEFANDWTHSNAIGYSPTDGDLIVSMRHQDWVVKINYDNGVGDGTIEWRLGPEGDFAINSADPFPWPSHQHDAKYVADDEVVIYDNGNTRCVGNPTCNSRGQVFKLDELNNTASLELNADLGIYAPAVGSAQKLITGGYHFNSGLVVGAMGPEQLSVSQEVLPNEALDFALHIAMPAYRSFRLVNLYRGTEDSRP